MLKRDGSHAHLCGMWTRFLVRNWAWEGQVVLFSALRAHLKACGACQETSVVSPMRDRRMREARHLQGWAVRGVPVPPLATDSGNASTVAAG